MDSKLGEEFARPENRKCFNHVHVQTRGFTKSLVFLKRVSLLNPRVHANFVAFLGGHFGYFLFFLLGEGGRGGVRGRREGGGLDFLLKIPEGGSPGGAEGSGGCLRRIGDLRGGC